MAIAEENTRVSITISRDDYNRFLEQSDGTTLSQITSNGLQRFFALRSVLTLEERQPIVARLRKSRIVQQDAREMQARQHGKDWASHEASYTQMTKALALGDSPSGMDWESIGAALFHDENNEWEDDQFATLFWAGVEGFLGHDVHVDNVYARAFLRGAYEIFQAVEADVEEDF